MNTVLEFLKGRKTYLVGVLAILGAALAWAEGAMTMEQAVQAAVAAIMAMLVRNGVTAEVAKIVPESGEKK